MGTLAPTNQQPPLDISKALHELFNEVISGTAHLNAARSLAEASKTHPVIMMPSLAVRRVISFQLLLDSPKIALHPASLRQHLS
jgi:hypothetical protein